jgi:hypothetical protein
MPVVDGKHYPYTKKGKAAAKKAAKKSVTEKYAPLSRALSTLLDEDAVDDRAETARKKMAARDKSGNVATYPPEKTSTLRKGITAVTSTGPAKLRKAVSNVGKRVRRVFSGKEAYTPMYNALTSVLTEKKKAKDKKGKEVFTDPSYGETAGKMQYRNTMGKPMKEDSDWIQKAVDPKHKGYCTPMTKSTCTPPRKALAKRFKKAARKGSWKGKV